MTERLNVDAPAPLLAFLRSRLDGWRVKTLKERLRMGCVLVNGDKVTQHVYPLQAGDCVEVGRRGTRAAAVFSHPSFTTLYLDDDLIAIDKPAGLLSVSTDRQRQRTALALVRDSLSTPARAARLFPVHRLDRETSGVLLFARSKEIQVGLQSTWNDSVKIYHAVVEGHPDPGQGIVDQALSEDRSLNVRVSRRPEAKDAVTRYRTSERGRNRTLLEVELVTGRRHQIRSHLAWLGHPIVGDRRYGKPGNRMGLHALRLQVTHPSKGSRLVFEAPPPNAFSNLLNGE